MKRVINWLQNMGLRQIVTVFLVAIAFLVIPAFSYNPSLQAQAETLIAGGDSYTVDSATVKRIQEKAEDLGDRSEKRGGRPIGDTGLKNIKNLGENIPETLEMRARTDAEDAFSGDQKKALDKAQNRVGGVIDSAKRAVKDVID
jgi:predicted PurR-regulated permease PerM